MTEKKPNLFKDSMVKKAGNILEFMDEWEEIMPLAMSKLSKSEQKLLGAVRKSLEDLIQKFSCY